MGFLHLVLLVTFLVSWLCKKITACNRDSLEVKLKNTLYTKALFSSSSVSVFNLFLFLFDYFSWIGNGWSVEKIVTLLALAVIAVSWGAVCIYMHNTGFMSSGERSFPLFFRVWCGFYFCFSCYCFIMDMILFVQAVLLPIHYLVSDLVCVFSGLSFCYMGMFVQNDCADNILDEPLLDDIDNQNVGNLLSTKASETITPYSTAGLFSILNFYWMRPLIDAGNKKTMGLEDVPQLASSVRVFGVFPTFRNVLEVDCGTISRVTAPKLMKLLIFSA